MARKYALIALGVLLVDEAAGVALLVWDARSPWFDWYPYGPIVATLGHWGLPFAAVYLLERKGWRSLGLELPRRKVPVYALYALVGLVAPGVFLGFDRGLLIEFIEQIAYIGLAEELFFRGYVTSRFLAWLGNPRGLLASAFLFSFVHFVSRVAQSGFAHPLRLVEVCLQTLVGGLLLGYIYIRAKNIYPGSILHVSGNMYIGRLIEVLSQ